MHNLKPYDGDAYSLYKDAVERKDDGDAKSRLLAVNATIEAYYKEFDKLFQDNTLRTIPAERIKGFLWKDLYDMYGFDASIVKQVKSWLKENNPVTVYAICQFCGLAQFDTMDHILPHKKYVEYSVHARNLIPCCTDCNRQKQEREVLNLYTDILPEVEYLFMDVIPNGDTIDFLFELINAQALVPAVLFSKIENHYSKLGLFEKMYNQSVSQLTRFVVQINSQYNNQGKEAVVASVNEEIAGLRSAYGYNCWEAVFKKGLVSSPIFWDYYEKGMLE